jgi:hypothetical protein
MTPRLISLVFAASVFLVAGAQREPTEDQLQQMLRRFPDADLNKDGKLTRDEFLEFRRKMRSEGADVSPRSGASPRQPASPQKPLSPEKVAPPPGQGSPPPQAHAGFLGVQQRDGVWWFVSAKGEPLVSIGLNHVVAEFLLLPPNKKATMDRYGADIVDAAGRFNSAGEGAKRWMDEVLADMRDWGFNTLGMHTPRPTMAALGGANVYYLPSIRVARIDGPLEASAAEKPDVFSENFVAKVEATAKAVCADCAHDPRVLGYCYCDLPHWTDAEILGRFRNAGLCGSWGDAIRSQPAQTAGKQAWMGLLQGQYKSAADAAAAYGLAASSWEELAQTADWNHPRDKVAAARDADALTAMIAERWYGYLHDAIRRHDTQHLIFGDKLKYDMIPPLLLPVLKKYVDVILIQDVKEPLEDQLVRFSRVHAGTGKPILSGDSGFSAPDPNKKHLKGFPVGSYKEVGEHYAAYLKGIMGLPFVVGWHYCGYIEGCAGTRLEGQEGFKDAFGKTHVEVIGYVREANAKAVEWHRASRP